MRKKVGQKLNKEACETCGSVNYYHWVVKRDAKGIRFQYCNDCTKMSIPNLSPDVYFDKSKGANQTDPNLSDRYKGPIPFSSKREKAAILKRLGLREAGDREHGSRNFDKQGSRQWDQ